MKKEVTSKEKKLKHIQANFIAFLAATSLSDKLDRYYRHVARSYGCNSAFLGWSKQPYHEAVKAIQEVCPTLSEKTIGRCLVDLMVELFERAVVREDADPEAEAHVDSILTVIDQTAISKEVSELIDFLQSKVASYTVFIPIQGVELQLSRLELGDFTLYPSDEGPLFESLKSLKSGETAEHIEKVFRAIGCYAVLSNIEGDSRFVTSDTPRKAQDVVHMLNFLIASCRRRHAGFHKITLVGQPTDIGTQSVVYAASEKGQTFSESVSSFRRYQINQQEVEKWNTWGADKVIECFTPMEYMTAPIQDRIKRSLIWYSKGVNADREDEQFVALAISLESLLIGKEESDVNAIWGKH